MCKVIHSSRLIFTIPSPQEVVDIYALNTAFYQYAFSPSNTYEQLVHEMTKSTRYEFIAFDSSGNRIGYINGYCPVANCHVWIQTLVVHEEYSRKGYGSEILFSFLEHLNRNFELKKVYLTCHQLNVIGNSFWKKLGFQVIEYNIKNAYFLYNTNVRSLLCTKSLFSP